MNGEGERGRSRDERSQPSGTGSSPQRPQFRFCDSADFSIGRPVRPPTPKRPEVSLNSPRDYAPFFENGWIERRKVGKAKEARGVYNYQRLSELADELWKETVEFTNANPDRMPPLMLATQRNLYGIVVQVFPPLRTESGAYRLRIMDDSSREKVPLRIHTSGFDRTMGPEVKVGDVIRVHRAAVQIEFDLELQRHVMCLSTTPHRNYVLFRKEADDEIACLSCAEKFSMGGDVEEDHIQSLVDFASKIVNGGGIIYSPHSPAKSSSGIVSDANSPRKRKRGDQGRRDSMDSIPSDDSFCTAIATSDICDIPPKTSHSKDKDQIATSSRDSVEMEVFSETDSSPTKKKSASPKKSTRAAAPRASPLRRSPRINTPSKNAEPAKAKTVTPSPKPSSSRKSVAVVELVMTQELSTPNTSSSFSPKEADQHQQSPLKTIIPRKRLFSSPARSTDSSSPVKNAAQYYPQRSPQQNPYPVELRYGHVQSPQSKASSQKNLPSPNKTSKTPDSGRKRNLPVRRRATSPRFGDKPPKRRV